MRKLPTIIERDKLPRADETIELQVIFFFFLSIKLQVVGREREKERLTGTGEREYANFTQFQQFRTLSNIRTRDWNTDRDVAVSSCDDPREI